uniref:Uncharacterized protein n=1 Tax=Arundo donax TaxID=35708 RepID=A0A0A8YA10_ARUDO
MFFLVFFVSSESRFDSVDEPAKD